MCGCATCNGLRARGIPVEDQQTSEYVHVLANSQPWWQAIVLPLVLVFQIAARR